MKQPITRIAARSRELARYFFALLSFIALMSPLAPRAYAITNTWTGQGASTNGNWSAATNWGGTGPDGGDNIIFAGTTGLTNTNNLAVNGTANVNINLLFATNAGAFVLNGTNATASALILTGPGVLTNLSTNLQTINFGLTFQTATANIDTASNSVILNGIIAGTNITKSGAATLFLNGTNTFTGIVTNNAGAIRVGNNSGLGTTNSGTVIVSGAALELTTNNAGGNLSIGAESLSLAGTGISSGGALRNITGSNTYGGLITLTNATRINADAGTLLLTNTGTITGANCGLTFGGAGNIALNSIIGTTTGTVTKDGAGTLTLSGSNTYTGATTLEGGTTIVLGSISNSSIFTVGNTISGNRLVISNGGSVSSSESYIGYISADNNSVLVTGAGSRWNSIYQLYLGYFGAQNSLVISNGGMVTSTGGSIGLVSSDNSVLVTGAGSLWTNNGYQLTVGFEGSGDSLTIADGGTVAASSILIASEAGSSATLNIGRFGGSDAGGTLIAGSIAEGAGAATVNFNQTNSVTITSTITGANLSLNQLGSGTTTLTRANTYSGTTTISAGVLALSNTDALSGSTLDYSSAGRISFLSLTGVNLGGLQGSTNLALTNASGGAVALNVGGNSANTTYSGILSGAGSLTKVGAGTLVLSGLNTYGGTTTIAGGTLQVTNLANAGANSAISTNGTIILSNGGVFSYAGASNSSWNRTINLAGAGGFGVSNSTVAVTNSGAITNTGNFTKSGAGTLILSASNSFSGTTTISAGVLALSNTNALSGSTLAYSSAGTISFLSLTGVNLGGLQGSTNLALTNASGGAVALNVGANSSNTTYSGILSGAGSLTKAGAGTLILGAANTYTGGTTINAGTVAISNGASFGSNTVTFASNGTTVAALASVRVTNNYALSGSGTMDVGANVLTNSGVISGAGSLTKAGAGTMVLGAANTYAGGTTINAGTVAISNGASFGSNTVTFASNGTTMAALASVRVTNNYALTGSGTMDVGANVLTNSGVISGAGNLTKAGAGTMVLSGLNTYGGTTTVGGGTLQVTNVAAAGTSSAIGTNGTIILTNGGTLDYAGTTNTAMNRGINLASGNGGIGVSNAAVALTNTGVISNSGTLVKSGAGTLILGAANTYTGGTTINAGTVAISNGSSFGSNTVTFGSNGTTVAALASVQVTNNYALTGNGTMDVGANVLTNSGVISGAGSLTKAGAGTMVLGAANTYTGGTTINTGTVAISNGASFGSNTVTFASNGATVAALASVRVTNNYALSGSGTMDVGANVLTNSGVISGAGSLTKAGAGTMVLGAANTYTGGTTINAGTVAISNGSSFGSNTVTFASNGTTVAALASVQVTNNYALTGNGTMDVGANVLTNSGVISGAGSLTKAGAGTMVLGAANTYTGGTTINAGTVAISNGSSFGSNTVTFASNGTTVAALASVRVTNNYALTGNGTMDVGANVLTNSGVISGAGSLTKAGAGTMVLGAANTYTGGTTINAGTVAISNGSSFGSNTVTFASNGTTVAALVSMRVTNNYALTGSGTMDVGANVLTNSGVISGAGNLTKAGAGTMVLSGLNTYGGTTTVGGGTLQVTNVAAAGTSSAIGTNGTIILTNGGTLDYAGTTNTAMNRGINLASGNGGIGVSNAAVALTNTGVISNSGTLVKSGAGTLILGASNTYTGGTTISAGTLRVAGSLSTNGAVTVNNGGTLAGSGSVGSVTVNSGATITSSGGGSVASTLSVSSLILNGGASYLWNLQGSVNDLIAASGGITFNGTSGNLMTISILTNATTSWNSATSTNFTIMTAGSGFTGFNAAAFAFSGTNSMTNGTWSIQTSGNNLNLLYTTIPAGTWTNGSGNLSAIGIINNSMLKFNNPNYTARVTNNAQVTALSGITFNAGAGTNTLSGSNVSIGAAGIVNNSAATQTVALGLTQSAASSVTAASGNLVISGSLNTAGYNLTLNGSSNTTVSGSISGSGAITKSGTGTTTLTGNNSYSGTTTISGGALQIGNGGTNGTLGSGDVNNNATLIVNFKDSSYASGGTTLANAITGNGNLILAGTDYYDSYYRETARSFLYLTGSNSYTGRTTIKGGVVVIDTPYALGSTNSTLDVAGGILVCNPVVTLGSVFLGNAQIQGEPPADYDYDPVTGAEFIIPNPNPTLYATITASSITATNTGEAIINVQLAGTGGFTQSGTGTTILAASNTYSGGTLVQQGKIQVFNNEAYYGQNYGLNTPSSAFGTGTVTITGNTPAYVSLAYQLRPRVDLGGKTVTNTFVLETLDGWDDFLQYELNPIPISGFTNNVQDSIANGTIDNGAAPFTTLRSGSVGATLAGTGGYIQDGGNITLKAANTYTGGTTIINRGNLTVYLGGTLGSTTNALNVANGTLSLKSYAGISPRLTVGSLTLGNGTITGSATEGAITASNITATNTGEAIISVQRDIVKSCVSEFSRV